MTTKRTAFEALVGSGADQVLVFLHPHPALVLPDRVMPRPDALTILKFTGRVLGSAELSTGDDGFAASLSFGGEPFRVSVPWDAVRSMDAIWPAPVVKQRPALRLVN